MALGVAADAHPLGGSLCHTRAWDSARAWTWSAWAMGNAHAQVSARQQHGGPWALEADDARRVVALLNRGRRRPAAKLEGVTHRLALPKTVTAYLHTDDVRRAA